MLLSKVTTKNVRLYLAILFLLFLTLALPYRANCDEGEWVPGVVHLHTKMGEGTGVYSALEMEKRVKEKGLGVGIINDHDNEIVEYGILPLRNIIKKRVTNNSLNKYGVKRFLDAVGKADREIPEVIFIPAIEAVPAYYWDISLMERKITLRNWHKHILIFGLDNPEDIEGLPSVGKGWPVRLGIGCILNLWPIFLFPFGLFLVRYKRARSVKFSHKRIRIVKRPFRTTGILLFAVGAVLLVNNFPFCSPAYDQYHGDQGIGPYQEVIDYANSKGALTFWAHPDVIFDLHRGGVRILTKPHPNDLILSHGYTGFAALLEGVSISRPGGIWDRLLMEYLDGKRENPLWAIGELDYKSGNWMGETQTVFYLKKRSKEEVINALRYGRVYAVSGLPYKPVIKHFEVWDEWDKRWKTMGSTAYVYGKARIRIAIQYPVGEKRTLRLIEKGKVVMSWPLEGDFETEWVGTVRDKTYFRIDIDSILVGNPVFVQGSGG